MDDIVTRLRQLVAAGAKLHLKDDAMLLAADDIKRLQEKAQDLSMYAKQDSCEIEWLRVQIDELIAADFEGVWDDTLIPIAVVLGVPLNDEHGMPRRQSQMVEAIIRAIRDLQGEATTHR